MLRSMQSAVAGLQAHQQAMDVVANNIANVNTTGFKSSQVVFEDTFYQTIASPTAPSATGGGGANGMQIGYGSTVGSIDTNFNQGAFGSTGDPLDLYINGDGFFRVQDASGNVYYTRMGNFSFNSDGYLVDSNGNYVTGFKEADVEAADQWNKDVAKYNEDQMKYEEYLEEEADYQAELVEWQTAHDAWDMADGTMDGIGDPATEPVKPVAPEVVDQPDPPEYQFDAEGNPISAPLPGERKYDPTTGTYTANGSETPPATEDDLAPVKIDEISKYTDISIGETGQITALNSETNEVEAVGQIVLTDIPNPGGMMAQGGGYYKASGNSGDPIYGAPSGETTGTIISGGLEMSNVDLSTEFTDMITIQRGFQACARIITTSDEMLQELINLKR